MKDVKGMEWRKEFDSNYTHYINFLLYAMTFLLIISIFFQRRYIYLRLLVYLRHIFY